MKRIVLGATGVTAIVAGVAFWPQPTTITGPEYAPNSCQFISYTTQADVLPDPNCTPGKANPKLTKKILCSSGFSTKSVRPPVALTNKYKAKTKIWYNYKGNGEYDHLIPLELGGANDTRNLWVEPGSIPNTKDNVEDILHMKVCNGELTLSDAQHRIATNWLHALDGLR